MQAAHDRKITEQTYRHLALAVVGFTHADLFTFFLITSYAASVMAIKPIVVPAMIMHSSYMAAMFTLLDLPTCL